MSQHESIKARAEQLWRELGCPCGRDEEIWLMAEEAVKRESTSVAKPATKTTKPRAAAAKKTDAAKPAAKSTATKTTTKK